MKNHHFFRSHHILFLHPSELLAHEEVDPNRLKILEKKIRHDGHIKKPIFIDAQHKVILDGHHRWTIAKKLRLKKIPTIALDIYHEELKVFPFRGIPVDKQLVIESARKKCLFPPRTTRHVWGENNTPLAELLPEGIFSLTLLS